MPKPVSGTLFNPALHFEVGDLIYGINKQRFWMTELISRQLQSRDTLLSADHLNNQFLGTGVSGAGKNYNQGTQGSPGHKQSADEYKTWLEAHTTKNGAKQTLSDAMKTADESAIDDLYDAPQRFSRIKRSCKAGIAYATIKQRKKIHFIVTGVDMRKTVHKPPESQNWITAKELRSVFRRWNDNDIKQGVLFWENDFTKLAASVPDGQGGQTSWDRKIVACKAPWELDPALWRAYRPKDPNAYRLFNPLNPNAATFVPQQNRPLNPNAPEFVPNRI